MGVLWRKIKVVTWKCLVMRRRHWILTLFEILIPTAMFGGLLYGLSMMPRDKDSDIHPAQIVDPASADYLISSLPLSNIKYCPQDPNIVQLMDKFKEELKAKEVRIVGFNGYDSELEMMHSFRNDSSDATHEMFGPSHHNLGIVVRELSGQDAQFSYTLRTDTGDTASLFPDSIEPGPGQGFKLYAIFFAPIQIMLDRIFTQTIVPKTAVSDWKISVQPNPYPEYTKVGKYAEIFGIGFPFVTAFSFLFMFPLILTKVVQEKLSGVKELQQMMGLPSWMIWYGFLFNSLLTAMISMLLVLILLMSGLNSFNLLKYSDWSILFVLLLLYVTNCIFYCFLVASIFLKATPSLIVGMVLWCSLLIMVPSHITSNTAASLRFLASYFPGYSMVSAFKLFGNFEANGVGMKWSNLFSTGGNANTLSMGVLLLNMCVSIFIMAILTWYLDNIRPGPYGLKKSYFFFLKKSYWGSGKGKSAMTATDHAHYTAMFEPPPPNAKVGIRVRDLTKNFGNFVAVDNVSIDFYEGTITALLGHNGAGKTTTMSILTGMFPPSSGEVMVQNYNIFKHMDQFRDSLGLCPQHNLLFPYLSVIQHLIFFGMIKGMPRTEAKDSGLKLLRLLNILEKRNQPVSSLSGGMKRKLQLAIALIGGPKVLMLDEPTSGMDPESRREMWDLLLSMRGDRTIIITTHFMEEADVLGDRIAIMDHGKIKCYGTTLFLKKVYGAGYQLTFLTTDKIQVSSVTQLIQSYVPDATLHNTQSSQLTYTLPTQDTSKFPALFESLETKKTGLGISSIGIACTTIEEVFLKVGDLAAKEKDDDSLDGGAGGAVDPTKRNTLEHPTQNGAESNREPLLHQKVQGIRLFMLRFSTLFKKRSIFFRRNWFSSLLHTLDVVLVLAFLMWITRINSDPAKNPNLTFSPSVYHDSIYYAQNKAGGARSDSVPDKVLRAYEQELPDSGPDRFIKYKPGDNITAELLKFGEQREQDYRTKVLAGAVIEQAASTVMFNSIPLHAMPISLNLHSTALLRALTDNPKATITTSNHPINFDAVPICDSTPGENIVPAMGSSGTWAIILSIIMPIFFSMYFKFPVLERVNSCKQLQLMTGTSWITYWLSLFTFDYIVTLGIFGLALIGIMIVDLSFSHLITYPNEIAVLLFLLVLFGLAMLLMTYSYSLIVTGPDSIGLYYVLNLLVIPVVIILVLLKQNLNGIYALLYYAGLALECIFPLPAFAMAVYYFFVSALNKSRCYLCPGKELIQLTCKNMKLDRSYIRFPDEDETFYTPGYPIGWELLFLLYSVLVHVFFISFVELQFNGMVAQWLVRKGFQQKSDTSFDQPDGGVMSKDPDVLKEKDRVDGLMAGRTNSDLAKHKACDMAPLMALPTVEEGANLPIFIVQNIKKTFFLIGRKFGILPVPRTFDAVRGVSFAVSPGECFGLLGVNGAGKTTTFRMLTGDTVCTEGDASLFGYHLSDRKNYLSGIGYCPQFNGINEHLTAQEMLECFAALRGIPSAKSAQIINYWIELLGLTEYRYRRSGRYSGGNKRKLSTAMALIGDPPLVFLDEPTSGVDPISRHRLWKVLSQIQKTGQAIVLTSHSMDECEALCNRLTIMVRGQMQCLGNITYLKQRYGQGFTLMIKLREGDEMELKRRIMKEFDNKIEIKDEHKGLIHYNILDTSLSWFTMFSKMESLKSSMEIVEDYSLSDSTLEQIFIAFAKGKGHRNPVNNTITEL
uniref:ATP-binding cassette sub-family A member 3 n=1 Tax=Cacopsylla melanoneura TaxID=428564 RepID=A0A8D8ZYL0_9HEMI